MKWALFGAAVLVSLVVIARLAPEHSKGSVQQAEFATMQSCLAGIEEATGQALAIQRDKPHLVNGNLADGRYFACARRETGSRGVYVEGSFDSH